MCRCKEMWLWKVAKKKTHSILSTEEKVRVSSQGCMECLLWTLPKLRTHSSFHPEEIPMPDVSEAPVLVKPACSPGMEALRSRFFLGF